MTSRHLPPRDCMVLLNDGAAGTAETWERQAWVHARYSAAPLSTWSDKVSGEPIDLSDVVMWDRLPEDRDAVNRETRRRLQLAIDELRTIHRTNDNVSALNKAQSQLEEIWEDLGA